MEGKMKVAVMLGIGKMGFEERDIPKAKDDEVLVKLEYVGICGSDLHYYETGAIGDYVVEPPFVLGHEPGGEHLRDRPAPAHLLHQGGQPQDPRVDAAPLPHGL